MVPAGVDPDVWDALPQDIRNELNEASTHPDQTSKRAGVIDLTQSPAKKRQRSEISCASTHTPIQAKIRPTPLVLRSNQPWDWSETLEQELHTQDTAAALFATSIETSLPPGHHLLNCRIDACCLRRM